MYPLVSNWVIVSADAPFTVWLRGCVDKPHEKFSRIIILAIFSLLGCSRPAVNPYIGPNQGSTNSSSSRSASGTIALWDEVAAASYLDQRAAWWAGWSVAARDHNTFCVSCHTTVPYVLARPALRKALAESGPSSNEQIILQNVRTRVRLWKEVKPYYTDNDYSTVRADESRATESVMNSFVLANFDAQNGQLTTRHDPGIQKYVGVAKDDWGSKGVLGLA